MKVFHVNVFSLDGLPGGFRPCQGQSGQSLALPAALGKSSEPAAAAALGKTAAAVVAAAVVVVVVVAAAACLVSGGKICIQLLSSSPCN